MAKKQQPKKPAKQGRTAGSTVAYGSQPVAAAPSAPQSLPVFNADGSINRQNVMANYENAYRSANQANEARYGDIITGYGQRIGDVTAGNNQLISAQQKLYDDTMREAAGLGLQEQSDLRQDWDKQAAQADDRMRRMGLAGTTVMPTMSAGVEKQKQADMSRLNERLQRERLGMMTDLGQRVNTAKANALQQTDTIKGDRLNFMERREDMQPDMGMYAQLMTQAGNGNGGSVGGGGGTGGVGGGAGGGATGSSASMSPSDIVGYRFNKTGFTWPAGSADPGAKGNKQPVTREELMREMNVTGSIPAWFTKYPGAVLGNAKAQNKSMQSGFSMQQQPMQQPYQPVFSGPAPQMGAPDFSTPMAPASGVASRGMMPQKKKNPFANFMSLA